MENATLAILKRYGIPLTRENYLLANSPDGEIYTPSAEEEADIPDIFKTSSLRRRMHKRELQT